MSNKAKKEPCGMLGGLSLFVAMGIIGGIENGASLFNFVYSFAAMIGGAVAMDMGGFLK